MDLDIKRADTKHASHAKHSPSSRGREQKPVDYHLNRQIEVLIPRLTRYARALTCDGVAADDLVQDCLARALGKIHLWEQGTDLRAWLFTIMHHQHISRTRRDARHRASLELRHSHPSLTVPPNQTVQLEFRDLQRAIVKLPEEQRSVILLVGLEGMAYEEAASLVNTPVGTVRSRVARGRENLRAMTELFPTRHSRRTGKAHLGSSSRPSPMRHLRVVPDDAVSVPKSKEVVQ